MDKDITRLIEQALAEDIRSGDITSEACIHPSEEITAKIVMKQAGIIAGLPFLTSLFHKIDNRIDVNLLVDEGSYQKAGTVIATVSGPARGIITCERVALNFLQHAAGVATATHEYVKKVEGFGCAIIDTRRTLPGLRSLEKYAVRVGGGVNHRYGLDDRFVIKRSHRSLLAGKNEQPILEALRLVKERNQDLHVEIEVDDLDDLDEALKTDAKVIILVNMTPDQVERAVEKIKPTGKKVFLESSGTITLNTIRAYAEKGVNAICIGALTHSVQALDISMKI